MGHPAARPDRPELGCHRRSARPEASMIRRLAGLAVSVVAAPAVLLGLPALSPESFASPAGITARPAPDALSGAEVAATAFRAGLRCQALAPERSRRGRPVPRATPSPS